MGVNLLPQASTKDLSKADTSLRGLVMVVMWVGTLITIFVVLLLNQGVENGRLKDATTQRTVLLNKIEALGQTQDDYYTLAYKSLVLSRIKTEQYVPSVIGDYVKKKVEDKGNVSRYTFDAKGQVSLTIDSDTYYKAVLIWHDLLKDKTVFSELSLQSFSKTDNKVVFQLKGQLNLEELYKQHGITK